MHVDINKSPKPHHWQVRQTRMFNLIIHAIISKYVFRYNEVDFIRLTKHTLKWLLLLLLLLSVFLNNLMAIYDVRATDAIAYTYSFWFFNVMV